MRKVCACCCDDEWDYKHFAVAKMEIIPTVQVGEIKLQLTQNITLYNLVWHSESN